jgi:formate hydrogenlyase subunit 6/NADH:ubiquinone oxidoreductase subunit I
MSGNEQKTRQRTRWIDHLNACIKCRNGAELCPEGAELAREVLSGMAPDESLECRICAD